MEINKFRIKRVNPDISWTIPCTGGTNYWPINLSPVYPALGGCSGLPMHNSTGSQVLEAINGDIYTFPNELKKCSPTKPCVILWDVGNMMIPPGHCTSADNYAYVQFKGINISYMWNGVPTTTQDSYNQIESIIDILKPQGLVTGILPFTSPCFCNNILPVDLSKVEIFISQDFNDIGHYTIWDGNIGQKEVFSNFIISAMTSWNGSQDILVNNTTDFGYHRELENSPYTIYWGAAGNPSTTLSYPNLSAIYNYNTMGSYKIVIVLDSPWGPISTEKWVTIPLESYVDMFTQGQLSQANPLTGPVVGGLAGASTAYYNQYPNLPLDSGTDIQQYSGLTFGPGTPHPCFTVTGITNSILGNFQSYTNASSPGLPPGYNIGVVVPIGGDVLNPVTGGIAAGVYGMISNVNLIPPYTSYTISSAANASTTPGTLYPPGTAVDGSTPISFWDFPNGITIFEASSCGLDKAAFGAFECIACPSGETCDWCETKDEYWDRATHEAKTIAFNVNQGVWNPSGVYTKGDIVYDITWNSCCCFMAVEDISGTDPWFGSSPSSMSEGVYLDTTLSPPVLKHIWEGCSYDCISCPPGTQTPCNDYTVASTIYSFGNTYNLGAFVEDQHGNCYKARIGGVLGQPSGLTNNNEWDYISCVSWVCPSEAPVISCNADAFAGCTTSWWNLNQMGVYDPAFSPGYDQYDFVSYLGVCYSCDAPFMGSYPCGGIGGGTPPNINPNWTQCANPPQAASNPCVMITGDTLDTIDTQGNPITLTGFLYSADCKTFLNAGECFPNKWKCEAFYSCSGCTEINDSDPLYFTSLAYNSESACKQSCEPTAYSCTTPYSTGTPPCCTMLSCNDDALLYTSIMNTSYVLMNTHVFLAYNDDLFISPTYNWNDCNIGVGANTMNNSIIPPMNIAPTGDIDACCVNSSWKFDCENGCMLSGGVPNPPYSFPNSADCETWVLTNFNVTSVYDVPCSFYCTDPFIPFNPPFGPTAGSISSPCEPCYLLAGCTLAYYGLPSSWPWLSGPFVSMSGCATGCSESLTCWSCDCTNQASLCTYMDPCPTILPGSNPPIPGPNPAQGTYSAETDCLSACSCTFDWDCFWDHSAMTAQTGCVEGLSLNNIESMGWVPSLPTPFSGYSNFDECCIANPGCCYVECNVNLLTNPLPNPDWPCFYSQYYNIVTSLCNDPLGANPFNPLLPWCYMYDCTNYGLCSGATPTDFICCEEEDNTCECACSPHVVDSTGAYNSSWQFYNTDEAVYFESSAPDVPMCCFYCNCMNLGPHAPIFGSPLTYDCTDFVPGAGPAADGTVNCWVSCLSTPQDIDPYNPTIITGITWGGVYYEPCTGCTHDPTPVTYECLMSGCMPSAGPCIHTGGLTGPIPNEVLNNCYNNPNCEETTGTYPGIGACSATCKCDIVVPNCSDSLITYGMQWSTNNTITTDCPTPGLFNPPNLYPNYNAAVPANCCPDTTDEWYCDDEQDCHPVPSSTIGDGLGCVLCQFGDACYGNANNFNSLPDCESKCIWCCDPAGAGFCQSMFSMGVSVCPAGSNGPAFSAYGCFLMSSACDCALPPINWWCWEDNPAGGCISTTANTMSLWTLYGQGGTTAAMGGTPFVSQAQCEDECRWCCNDECAPGLCYLNWGGGSPTPCTPSTNGCATHYTSYAACVTGSMPNYPCYTAYTEYYCDSIVGCNTLFGPNTVATYTGPTALIDCHNECGFECGDMTCQCSFTTTPTWTDPYVYDTLADCLVGSNMGEKCCPCYDCFTNTISWLSDNGSGLWANVQTNFITPASPGGTVPFWVPAQIYAYGEVVLTGGINDHGCCYVCVYDQNPGAVDWTLSPDYHYQDYLLNVQVQVPPLNTVWMICDPTCQEYEPCFYCHGLVTAPGAYSGTTAGFGGGNCIEQSMILMMRAWYAANDPAYLPFWEANIFGQGQVSFANDGICFENGHNCAYHCQFKCEDASQPCQECCTDGWTSTIITTPPCDCPPGMWICGSQPNIANPGGGDGSAKFSKTTPPPKGPSCAICCYNPSLGIAYQLPIWTLPCVCPAAHAQISCSSVPPTSPNTPCVLDWTGNPDYPTTHSLYTCITQYYPCVITGFDCDPVLGCIPSYVVTPPPQYTTLAACKKDCSPYDCACPGVDGFSFAVACSGSILVSDTTECGVLYLTPAYFDYLDTLPTTTNGYSWNYNLGTVAGYDPYTFLSGSLYTTPLTIDPTNFAPQANSAEKVFEAIVYNNGMPGGATKPFYDWKFQVNKRINVGISGPNTDINASPNSSCSHLMGTLASMTIGVCADPVTDNYYMKLELGEWYVGSSIIYANQQDLYNGLSINFGIPLIELYDPGATGSEWNADGYLSNVQELNLVLQNSALYMGAGLTGLIRMKPCCGLAGIGGWYNPGWECFQWSGGTHASLPICQSAPATGADCGCALSIPWIYECSPVQSAPLNGCIPIPSGTTGNGGTLFLDWTACTQSCQAYWDCTPNGCTGPTLGPVTPYLTENACRVVCVHYDCSLTALQDNVVSWLGSYPMTVGTLPPAAYYASLGYGTSLNLMQPWLIFYPGVGWFNGADSPQADILKNSGGIGPYQGLLNDAFAHYMAVYPSRDVRETYFVNTDPTACSNTWTSDPICPYSDGPGCWNTLSHVGILIQANGWYLSIKSYQELDNWLGGVGCLNLPNPSVYDFTSLQTYMLGMTTCTMPWSTAIYSFTSVEIHPDKILCPNGVSCDCIEHEGTGQGIWWQSNYNDCKNHITSPGECCDIWFPDVCTCCESNLPALAISSGWTNSIFYSGPLDAGNQLQMKFLQLNPVASHKMWLNECVQLNNIWSPTQGAWTDCCACCTIADSYAGPIPIVPPSRHSCTASHVASIGGIVLSSINNITQWTSCGVDEDCVSCQFPAGTILG